MSDIENGHKALMDAKDALKSCRKSVKSIRATKKPYAKLIGDEAAIAADVHFAAANEALKLAYKHLKSGHGVVADARAAIIAETDTDPIPDIPLT